MTSGFERLARDFAALAHAEGRGVAPFRGSAAAGFARLPPERQRLTLAHFERYVGVCAEVVAKGGAVRDDRTLLWAMIKRLKLRPPSDLFSLLGDDDVIEIYSLPEQIQVFRNLAYIRMCSYTLDDLLTRPWYELFGREEPVGARFRAEVDAALAARPPRIHYFRTGIHVVDEIDSPEQLRCVLDCRFLAPLFDAQGRFAAALIVSRALAVWSRGGLIPSSTSPDPRSCPARR